MKEAALKLAKMIQSIPQEDRENLIKLMDACPVLNMESLAVKEKKNREFSAAYEKQFLIPKIKLISITRRSLVSNSPKARLMVSPFADELTPIVGQGITYYLRASLEEKEALKDVMLKRSDVQKQNILCTKAQACVQYCTNRE